MTLPQFPGTFFILIFLYDCSVTCLGGNDADAGWVECELEGRAREREERAVPPHPAPTRGAVLRP